MKKLVVFIVLVIGLVVLLCSCGCSHKNRTQSCTSATCLDCGQILSNAVGHMGGIWIVDETPNCTKDGSEHQVCLICNDTISTRKIPKSETHVMEWVVNKPATCTEEGVEHLTCTRCSEVISQLTIKAQGHTESEWITSEHPTCSKNGVKVQQCLTCNETLRTVSLTKTDHKAGEWIIDKAATCTKDGSKHQVCSACNTTIKSETIAKLGHKDGEWIVDKAATCTNDGSKHQVCSACNTTIKSETIAKLGHKNGEWIIDKAATCTENGSKHQVCSACNTTIKRETLTKLGHKYGEWIIDRAATCTENGSEHQVCSICNMENTQSVVAKGHTYEKTITRKDCFNDAKITSNCKDCGDTTVEMIKPISLSLVYTGFMSSSTTSGKKYTRQYTVNVQGGYGTVQLKYELFSCDGLKNPSSSIDFSTTKKTSVTYGEGESISQKIYQITAKDSVGNISIYRFNLADESIIYYSSETHSYDVMYNPQDDQLIYTCSYCQHTYSNSAAIKISVSETYSQFDTAGFKEWCQIGIGASGGYGTLYYKYEVFSSKTSNSPISNLTSDFSATKDWYGVKSAITVQGYVIRVTVKDDYGHMDILNVLITNSGIEIIN